MDRLPREAKDFLALTADGHDPPDARARERVQARLAAMALLPMPHDVAANTGALAASARGTTSWLSSSKTVLAGVVALTVGGGLWALSTRRPAPALEPSSVAVSAALPEPKQASAGSIEVSQLKPDEESAARGAPQADDSTKTSAEQAPSARAVRTVRSARTSASAEDSLAQETALLRRASDKLNQRELGAALSLLEEHRQTYRRSQLAEERNGLLVLAHCLNNPSVAAREARSFIANTPSSLLVARLESACGL